ncbi:superoxide dismutase [bacterium]|jgi:nickel superoxide dismutase|nr:superoxide dismutase [bacterium]
MKLALLLLFSLSTLIFSTSIYAHCQVPCGIYDDSHRIIAITEHSKTIEKAMNKIKSLSAENDKNFNQIIRWTNTKEEHATKIQHIVSEYFMTQRLKPVSKKKGKGYDKLQLELELLHEILFYAMKSKQTLDVTHTQKLRQSLANFKVSYNS